MRAVKVDTFVWTSTGGRTTWQNYKWVSHYRPHKHNPCWSAKYQYKNNNVVFFLQNQVSRAGDQKMHVTPPTLMRTLRIQLR